MPYAQSRSFIPLPDGSALRGRRVVRRRGLGAFTPYPQIVAPSVDPAVYRTPGYIHDLNLQGVEQDANTVNAQLTAKGCPNIGVDRNLFNTWWNGFSLGPGVGDPPPGPQPFWTGLQATQSDPTCAQYTYYVGNMGPGSLSLPPSIANNSLTFGVPADLIGVAIGGPQCDPSNPSTCFNGGQGMPAVTSTGARPQTLLQTLNGSLPSVANATQPPANVINSGAPPATLPPATSSNAPNPGTSGSGTGTSNGPGAIIQSLGLSTQTMVLIGVGIAAVFLLPALMGKH